MSEEILREIVFDVETTGFEAHNGHRMVEIGAVELINKKVTGQFFHTYINPERDMPKSAERVHGLTIDFLQDKPLFKEIIDEFLSFLKNDKLVIHNAPFDMGFLNHHLQELKKKPLPFSRAIDTLEIARKKFPGAKATLDALCTRYNVSLEHRDKHGALLDAGLLAEVYIKMVGMNQGQLNLSPELKRQQEIIKRAKPLKLARNFQVSEEELLLHAEFIKKIGL